MRLHLAGLPGLLWQRRASAILGVIIILMLWAGVFIIYRGDVEQDYRDVEQRNQNYALLFEENVLRSIGEIDKALLYIRRSVEAAKDIADYQTIVSSTDVLSEIIVQVAVIDANGISRGTNAIPAPTQIIDISDREHFKVHVNSTEDNLFISKPVIGRASGKWSVQFTRRFSNKDGSFAGVVVASMDPAHFTSLYNRVDLGSTTAVAMIGDDGIVRSSGGSVVARLSLGQDLAGTDLFNRLQSKTTAIFRDAESPWLDFAATARKVRNYPLWVVVSASESDIYKSSWDSLKQNVLIAALLTVLTLIALEQILRAEARAVQKSRHLQLTLKHISQGIMLVTKDRHVPIINQRCADLLQLPKEMVDEPPKLDDLAPYETRNGHVPLWSEADLMPSGSAASRKPCKPSITDFRRPDGTFIEVRKTRLPDGGFVQTFTDITTRREAEANVAKLASEDPLTRLNNRRVFRARLQELSKRSGDRPFAILFMDMDRFKVVNDTLGHHIGDNLLTEVAVRLRAIADPAELLFRLGGDEFALLMLNVDTHDAIERKAQQVIAVLTQPFRLGPHVITISVSIGIAVGPGDGKTEDDLLMAADLALYAVKSTAGGTYRFYEKAMTDEVNCRREIELDLREALENNSLELYYQPIFNLRRNTISGFEALSRWPHPTKGMISPTRFIPIAEDCGLIAQLGNWALMQACRTAAQWPGDLKISVNVSPIQLKSGNLIETVRRALAETGLKPQRLALEFVETVFLDDSEETLAALHALKALGVQIVLDDFGTGYSSLSYLRSFPFDTVKIDRCFIADLGASTTSNVIAQAVILIADGLGISTVAEGIETDQQLQFLKVLGCKEVQGFRLSKPVPAAQVPALINGRMLTETAA